MPITEAQKRANKKWDAENMITLSCRIKKEDAERFRALCQAQGKTANTVLKEFIQSYGQDSGNTNEN